VAQAQELDLDRIREHGREIREALDELADATKRALGDAEKAARSGVRTRPYATLGTAFAVGWVLGGGIPVRVATLATSALGRAALGLAAARLAEGRTDGGHSAKKGSGRARSERA
jgi:hypothetical protein